MKRALLCTWASMMLLAAGACASSEDGPSASPALDGGPSTAPDREPSDASTTVDADAASVVLPRCSPAGWCTTKLPVDDLVLKDVWPHAARAFAVAESPTLGAKVLEWEQASDEWKFIDDNTQNEDGLGNYVGKIWSPNDDEIYFAVAPAFIYRGTRQTSPGTGWSWSRERLPDQSHPGSPIHAYHDHGYPEYAALRSEYPAVGIWGTSAGDVYAWYGNAIFRLERTDAGAATWSVDYVAGAHDSDEEEFIFVSATGTGPDDLWFAGGRDLGFGFYACPILIHKTAGGYQRIVDGVILFDPENPCGERPGTTFVGGARGWLTDVQPTGAGGIVALKGGLDVVRIEPNGEGYSVKATTVPHKVPSKLGQDRGFFSRWSVGGDIWLSGWGLVVRSSDGESFTPSTLSLNGGPIALPFFQVRGTSSTNLWAIGAHHAFHKTTP